MLTVEFKFKHNYLYIYNNDTNATSCYTTMVKLIHDVIFGKYAGKDRKNTHDRIDNDLKIILEEYEEQGLRLMIDHNMTYHINQVICYDKEIHTAVEEQLNAYVVMKKLTPC